MRCLAKPAVLRNGIVLVAKQNLQRAFVYANHSSSTINVKAHAHDTM